MVAPGGGEGLAGDEGEPGLATKDQDGRFHSPRVCWSRIWGTNCSGERARRSPTTAAAGNVVPANRRGELDNKQW
jgi:hypothetical protein